MVSSAPRFCRACGDSLPRDAAFCPGCGTAVDASPTAKTAGISGFDRTSSASNSQFRRRVRHYLARGWKVEHEFDDRVILVDRGFGSPIVHIPLFFVTSAVGNLVYAAYCYGPGAPRRELRTDGTVHPVGDDGWTSSLDYPTLAGIVTGFVGLSLVVALVAQGYGSLLVALLLATTLVLFGVLARGRVDGYQSPTTFGRKRTLTEQPVSDLSASCTDCGGPIHDGVERTFAERTYLAGFPVRTHESGMNRYCRGCASSDESVRSVEYDREKEREFV